MARPSTLDHEQEVEHLERELRWLRDEVGRLNGMIVAQEKTKETDPSRFDYVLKKEPEEGKIDLDLFGIPAGIEMFVPYAEFDLTPDEKIKFKEMWKYSYVAAMEEGAQLVRSTIDKIEFAKHYWLMRKALNKMMDRLEENRLLGAVSPEFEKPSAFNAYRSIFKETNEKKLRKLALFFRFICGESLDNYEYLCFEEEQKQASSFPWIIVVIAIILLVLSFFR